MLLGLLPEIHAFASQGYAKSTGNNYLFQDTKHGSFDFSEAAINVTDNLTDRLRMGIQLFARDIGGQQNNYQINVDWLYLDYHFQDWLGLRAGRTKLPFGLYNEVSEIDSAHVPVLLPQSVYPLLNRDLLLAQTGAELYGYVRIGPLGALDYRLYGGAPTTNPPAAPPGVTLQQFEVRYLFGGRILWETPLDGLRGGVSVQTLRFDENLTFPTAGGGTGVLDIRLPFVLWLASVEYSVHDWLFSGEYGRWRGEVDTNLTPPAVTINSRYYAMVSYRLFPWLIPGVYYAGLEPHEAGAVGNAKFQHDFAATLRFDINAHWLFKLEGHYVNGTADLDPTLNSGVALAQLPGSWTMWLAKTTVYF